MESVARRRGRTRTRKEMSGVRALDRGLLLLEGLAQVRELSLSEIARQVDLPYSTTFRLLETLRKRGFVAQSSETGLYRLGIRAFEVGSSFLSHGPLHEVAHPVMKALVDELNETVNLAVLDKREAVYIHKVEGRWVVRMFTQLGARSPLHCTGVGKVLLAWRSEEEVMALLGQRPLEGYTKTTLTHPKAILEELRRVRGRGYAFDNEEREVGVRCVAAPVRDGKVEVIAALSLSAPASRLPHRQVTKIAQRVMAAANEVSARLGWQP